MRNVKNVIEMFLKHISARDILQDKILYDRLSESLFLSVALPYMKEYTESELENICAAVKDMVATECDNQFIRGFEAAGLRNQPLNLYGLLLLATEKMLRFYNNEVVCCYQHLLEWRQLTVKISEDTFTTAFCAVEDLKSRKNRTRFDWPTVIGHDNSYLNKLLQQELSDNHFHLWASSPHFTLSWIRIMNDTDNPEIRKKLSDLDSQKLNVNLAYYQEFGENKFETLYLQAALLRLYLYSWASGREIFLKEYQLRNHVRESVLHQIGNGMKPCYLEIFRQWRCREEGLTWQEEFGNERYETGLFSNGTQRRDIGMFLSRLSDKEAEIPRKNGRSFWQCMEDFIQERKRFPLYPLEPVMEKDSYRRLWQMCTYDTVEAWTKNEATLQMNSRNVQLAVNALKCGNGLSERPDYVLWSLPAREQCENKVRWELCGERYFLYMMFRRAYQANAGDKRQMNLFYAYLVIKENFRSEIVQVNDRIGFRNFQRYDRRKGILLENSSFGDNVPKMAIEDTLSDPWIRSLEVRIVPRDTVWENVKYIRQIDGVQSDKTARYYFVYHFVKSPDDTPRECYGDSCRHERKRGQIRKQACCITGLRERFPQKAKRVLGIDACSLEIGCRPEVFAQAFRYLKSHCVTDRWKSDDERNLPSLKATYHVGEDFLDIIDGLRAIDEAVHFLNLNCGDRLGHALALGLDIKDYYAGKRNVICLPKQDYLDNLAWIYNRITKYRLGVELNNLRNHVEKEFSRYFGEVYDDLAQLHNYNIRTYFEAWKLRGDKPDYYRFGSFNPPAWQNETEGEYRSYDSYAVNYQFPREYRVRNVETVAYLYHAYHYDENVKIRGEEKKEFHIPECWIEGAEKLQKMLQQEIAAKGISIESNPTSNYMISVLDSYENHPIVRWYNHHLEHDPEKIALCPQLSVSINTDDKGCFNTSLENEYALMACALEKSKDENGWPRYSRTMIYEWLEEIRKMGNLQSFQERGE